MAWFYNGKQMYGAWTNAQGEAQVATWDADWTDAQKQQAGLISTGSVNTRFFEDDGTTKKTVSTIKADEEARMNGLKETILGETQLSIQEQSPEKSDDFRNIFMEKLSYQVENKFQRNLMISKRFHEQFCWQFKFLVQKNQMIFETFPGKILLTIPK